MPDVGLRLRHYLRHLDVRSPRESLAMPGNLAKRVLTPGLLRPQGGMGRWFRREEVRSLAEQAGFDCSIHESGVYAYRFHAVLRSR